MQTTPTKATNVANIILQSPGTTHWMRTSLQSALLRDPLDALHDAETLATALRMRCLHEFTNASPFGPDFTASLLQQHADSLSKLVSQVPTSLDNEASMWIKAEVGHMVVQLHDAARTLKSIANGSGAGSTQTLGNVPSPMRLHGKTQSARVAS
jgi:hypothetical protein